jgi:hypothetical protein
MGFVRNIVWVDGADPIKDALFAVFGLKLLLNPETGQKLVPIFMSIRK